MNEELKIIISAEIGDLKKEIQQATKEIKGLGGQTETESDAMSKAFSKMGDAAKKAGAVMAKALAAGITAAATGVATLATAAIKSYAEYEQLVGGVETLFKESSGIVQEYAANAYKTAGMSANEYMETVTGFSASLLQSLGGDTAKAASYADMAISDMSDNANKMGTSMESIQNAYQGFAKQNYTMLDNLKLGYGGTKEEMQRLLADAQALSGIEYDISSYADVVAAIHVIQDEMGITGTTAREAASTISGSVAMAKAAWNNLLTGMADDNADFEQLVNNFVESVTIAGENILPRVEIALNGVAQLIDSLLPVIVAKIPEIITSILPQILQSSINIVTTLMDGIMTTMPVLLESVITIIPQIVEAILALLPQLIDLGIDMITALLEGITEMLPDIINAVVEMIPEIINTIVDAIPQLLEAAIELFMAIVEAIPEVIPDLIDALPEIIDNILDVLIDNLPVILDGGIELFLALVDAIPEIIPELVEAIPEIIDSIVDALIDATPEILAGGLKLFLALATAAIEAIPQIINGLSKIVKNVKDNLIEKLKNLMKFDWSLPKLKLPKITISGKFSLSPLQVPTFSIKWNAKGGVFDEPSLFFGNGGLQGLGEDGAEAVVPLEKNTEWMNVLANKLSERMSGGNTPIVLQVDGKTFAQIACDNINQLTRQRGAIPLNMY